jgi:two-component system response regulator FlrC
MSAAVTTASAQDVSLLGGMTAIVRSPASRKLMEMARRVADSPASVLIVGETGSGKELVARALHQYSARNEKPWVEVNCAALPEHLLESELFGFEKGAFSGADSSKPGMFELAEGGTLFLDEIGELDARIQAKLLRVLDGAPYYRLGGTKKISVNVRVLAATNRELEAAVRHGSFRKDLFYRLGQIQIKVPPLRERPEDIVGIAEQVLNEHRPGARFTKEALDALRGYGWPGNVRELKNTVLAVATLADFDQEVGLDELPAQLVDEPRLAGENAHVPIGDLDSMERVLIERALESTGGDQGRAAEQLGISRRTLSRKLKLYRMEGGGNSRLGSLGPQQHRYFRAPLERLVTLRSPGGQQVSARALNVSASGIGIHELSEPLHFTGLIEIEFALEDDKPQIQAKGKMSWADTHGHAGIRFASMPPEMQRRLNCWLEARRQEEGWVRFE